MKIGLSILCVIYMSCGGGVSDYSESLSGSYTYFNRGEGANAIFDSAHKINPILWIKKYDDNGDYISVWQADTFLMQSPTSNLSNYKRNTFYPNDRFYIIEIKKEKLLGPYKKDDFFKKAKELNISIHWKPVVVD